MSDPTKAASKATQRVVLAALILLYGVYLVVAGTGGLLVLPVGAFLLLAVGYLVYGWWTARVEKQAG
ncbi:MAG TPA: hypothetical protein VNR42_11485 [Solirubrobacteraceae bacterium]|nr:hypothetical protein [Solirubrobacteraceae bacterium]